MSAEKRALQWLSGAPLGLVLLVGAAALFGGFWWLSNGGRMTRPASAQTGAAPAGSIGASVGTLARLQPSPGQSLWLARDGRAYDLFWRAQSAPDTDGARAMIEAGAVFTVEEDTEARVTAVGRGCVRVRLLEGERQGQEGWLPSPCLHAIEARRDF